MFGLSKKIDSIFTRIGDRGILILIFAAMFTLHTLLSLRMEMLSLDPNEFGTAAWIALFSGDSFSGVISRIDHYYGWAGAMLYAPVMLIVKNPFAQYKVMLIINSALASLVPVIAYKISLRLGANKAWQRVLMSVVSGIYPAVLAHTKFIWNETFCILFPWLTALIMLTLADTKNRAIRHLLSITLALVLVVSLCSHERLISVVAAAVLTAVFSRFFLKKKLIELSTFIPALIIFGSVFYRLTHNLAVLLQGDEAALYSTTRDFFSMLSPLFTGDSEAWLRLLQTVSGHLYYFTVSTWGLGILGVCLFIYSLKSLEPKQNCKFLIFSAFSFMAMLFSGMVSVLYKFNDEGLTEYQDAMIFGRYMDSITPLVLLSVICYIFLHGLDLGKLLAGTVALGAVFTSFFMLTARVTVDAEQVNAAPILSLYPLRIGEKIGSLITMDGLFLTVSSVFSLVALFIVYVCCSKKHRVHITTLSIALISLYSGVYTAVVYLPFRADETLATNQPIYEISEYVYDSDDAPPVIALNIPNETAALLQFLNQHANVIIESEVSALPESCYVILSVDFEDFDALENFGNFADVADVDNNQENSTAEELGRTDEYIFYALGEKAVMFANSQRE